MLQVNYWFKMNAKAAVNDVIKTIIDATLIPKGKNLKLKLWERLNYSNQFFFNLPNYIYNGLKKIRKVLIRIIGAQKTSGVYLTQSYYIIRWIKKKFVCFCLEMLNRKFTFR